MNSVSAFGNESGAQTGFSPILLLVILNSNSVISAKQKVIGGETTKTRTKVECWFLSNSTCYNQRNTTALLLKSVLKNCRRMLIIFVLARHFRTGCDLCWEECGVFPATAFSFERLLGCSARGRTATLLVPSSLSAQRSVLKGIELEFVQYRSLLNNKVCIHQCYMIQEQSLRYKELIQ